jgi:hypothetical protein
MDRHKQVGTVVQGDPGSCADHRRDVCGKAVEVLAVARVDLDALVHDQRSRDVVARGQRVGTAQRHLCPARPQRPRQVRRLSGDVQARPHRQPLQRPFDRQPLTDRAQDRHLRVSPRNPIPPGIGEGQVGDVRHWS